VDAIMTRLIRMLKINIKQTKGIKLSVFDRITEFIDNNSFIGKIRNWWYSISAFICNLPMFIKFAWGYRAWDYTFNIEIFVTLLETTAKNIKEHGHAVNSEKCARRAYTAAGLLRKAYLENVSNNTFKYLYKKYGYSFSKNYKIPSIEISHRIDKMRESAHKREDREEKALKENAWKYIHKYIEHLWD